MVLAFPAAADTPAKRYRFLQRAKKLLFAMQHVPPVSTWPTLRRLRWERRWFRPRVDRLDARLRIRRAAMGLSAEQLRLLVAAGRAEASWDADIDLEVI